MATLILFINVNGLVFKLIYEAKICISVFASDQNNDLNFIN